VKIRLITRGALVRLGILFLAIALAVTIAWAILLRMPGSSHRGPLPPLTDEERGLREILRRHVERLAGDIGERHTARPKALAAAADWIEGELRAAGYEPAREEFDAGGERCRNIIAEVPGAAVGGEILVVGAHYDSAQWTPGADDNATGVAALLEIARAIRGASPRRTVRLVAFVNEEPPYYRGSGMGSLVHARAARGRGDRIAAMVSLEMLGCYRDEPGSQSFPAPFGLLYPDTGNFIAFVGSAGSRSLVRAAVGSFRKHARFPSEGGAPPGEVQGVEWSDNWSFRKAGYQGIMVTDTAFFRNPRYHTPRDTPDTVDFERLARVVAGLRRVVLDLASP